MTVANWEEILGFLRNLQHQINSKGVTTTALLAKATAHAFAKHPVVILSCRDGKRFTYNSNINIVVAAAIDGGLITPVLRNADKVDIYSLPRKWIELVDKARAKQLQPQEYTTGIVSTLDFRLITNHVAYSKSCSSSCLFNLSDK